MPLKFEIGQSSLTGPRPRNEDYVGIVTPENEQLGIKGAFIAVADGVSGHAGGGEASEMTVRTVSTDYYATPDTWEPNAALDKVLSAANRWVLAQAAARKDLAGMATTISLMVLRGQRYYLAHVGDTRIYRLRQNQLTQLTLDHVWDRRDMRHVLTRAVGLDKHLTVDFTEGALEVGDCFALMSDGVWDVLSQKDLHDGLNAFNSPQMIAENLTKKALNLGGSDNATAVIVSIESIGEDSLSELIAGGRHLSVPPKFKIGDVIDGYEIEKLVHETRTSFIYLVRNTKSRQLCVLKTLNPLLANDTDSCQPLLNEEWLGRRVVSQYFPQIFPVSVEKRSQLYYLMSWHEGATFQQMLAADHHFTASETSHIGADLMRGLGALHRLNVVHRDIKPANIHLSSGNGQGAGSDKRLRILDLGVALSLGSGNLASMQNPGTPSFMAPELFDGETASIATDVYAAGVTLYHLLTRRYPFGEIEPFQRPKFGEPVPPTRYRPDIPQWLENIVLKAIAREPNKRFETAEEMLLALEHGELKPILAPTRTPLIARAHLIKWQWIAIFSFMLNFILIYLMLVS